MSKEDQRYLRRGNSFDRSVRQMKQLFKSLGMDTNKLKTYSYLYGTTKYTWGYVGSSMWYCTYYPHNGTIEINTTYFDVPSLVTKHNAEHEEQSEPQPQSNKLT